MAMIINLYFFGKIFIQQNHTRLKCNLDMEYICKIRCVKFPTEGHATYVLIEEKSFQIYMCDNEMIRFKT